MIIREEVTDIGAGEPCPYCLTGFARCWDLDGRYCCADCHSRGWSQAHNVEHEPR